MTPFSMNRLMKQTILEERGGSVHGAFLLKRIVCCQGNRGNLEKKENEYPSYLFQFYRFEWDISDLYSIDE